MERNRPRNFINRQTVEKESWANVLRYGPGPYICGIETEQRTNMAHGHNSLRNAAQLVNERRAKRQEYQRLKEIVLNGKTLRQKEFAKYLIHQMN